MLPAMWCRPSSQSTQSLPRGRGDRNDRRGFLLGACKRPLCVDSLHCLCVFCCCASGGFTLSPTSSAAQAASPTSGGRRGECFASVGGPFSPAHSHMTYSRPPSPASDASRRKVTQPHERRALRRWGIHEEGLLQGQGGGALRQCRGLSADPPGPVHITSRGGCPVLRDATTGEARWGGDEAKGQHGLVAVFNSFKSMRGVCCTSPHDW